MAARGRAGRPRREPGATGSRSSSSTMRVRVDREARAAGVRLARRPARCRWQPVSDAPKLSIDDARSGAASLQLLLHRGREDRAAPSEHEQRREVVRRAGAPSASTSGRAIASPMIDQRVDAARAAISSPDLVGVEVRPRRAPPCRRRRARSSVAHWAAPCISGASRRRSSARARRPRCSASSSGVVDRRRRREVAAAAAAREEDVLVAPHHALGHAGGAAGVEDVEVVGASARPKSRSGDCAGERVLVRPRVRARSVVVAAVLDHDEVPQLRQARRASAATVGANARS